MVTNHLLTGMILQVGFQWEMKELSSVSPNQKMPLNLVVETINHGNLRGPPPNATFTPKK